MQSFKKFLKDGPIPFDSHTTGNSDYDDIMNNKSFFEEKGIQFVIEWISIDEFKEKILNGIRLYGLEEDTTEVEEEKLNQYIEQINEGSKLPAIALKYVYDKNNKLIEFVPNGHHRLVIAEKLNLDSIPVVSISQRINYKI